MSNTALIEDPNEIGKKLPPGEHALLGEISVIQVSTELALRSRLIARVTGVAAITGTLISLLLPVRYTAVTRLMPPQQTQSTSSLIMSELINSSAGSLAAVAGAGLGLRSPNDIYVGLLSSRPISDAIIQKFDLEAVYHDNDMTAARKDLASYTQIVSEKSGFICVSATDRDKKRAAAIANEYIAQLRSLTQSLAVTEASQRRLFYETQLKSAKDALLNAQLTFQQVQQAKGVVQLDAQAKAMIESLSRLRAQITLKEVELHAMRSYSTERNPEVEISERELASLKDQAARFAQRSHSAGYSELGLEDVPAAGLDYLRAEHEVKYRQALFDLLIKQFDAARLDEAKEAAVIQVVETAIEPDRKSSPKRTLIIVLSIVAGFLGGCIAALFQWQREKMRSVPEIDAQLRCLKLAILGQKKMV